MWELALLVWFLKHQKWFWLVSDLFFGQKVTSLERIVGQLEVCQLVNHLFGHLRAFQSEQMTAERFAELLGLVKVLLVIESVEQTAVLRHIRTLNAMKMAVWTESKTFGLLKRILEKWDLRLYGDSSSAGRPIKQLDTNELDTKPTTIAACYKHVEMFRNLVSWKKWEKKKKK